ncbi:MAG TPA: hypothetical protein VGK10_01030 [Prolixibacteraceae bacterium]|jgi:hypothetical protein
MKKLIVTTTFILFALFSFSQSYGSVEYMGKKFYITSDFFQRLNSKYEEAGLNSKYHKVFFDTIDFLKQKNSVFIIDEAKRMSINGGSSFPYTLNSGASKSDMNRSSYINYHIILPVIEEYAVYAK